MASGNYGLIEKCFEKANLEQSIRAIRTEIEDLKNEAVELQSKIDALIRNQIAARANLDLEKVTLRQVSTRHSNITDNRNQAVSNDRVVLNTINPIGVTGTNSTMESARTANQDLFEGQRMILDDDNFRRQFLTETDDFEAEWR